jgi:TrmH family RNA methyltransferase
VKTPRPPATPDTAAAAILLEDIQDPGNLGSVLRSAAAGGFTQVLLSPGSVHAWSPRVLRAGMGAHFALHIHEEVDLSKCVHGYRGTVIAADPRASLSLFEVDLAGTVAFLFGNEGAGLSAPLLRAAHRIAGIPTSASTESLNVAAAAAVCIFERVRQRRAAALAPAGTATRAGLQ